MGEATTSLFKVKLSYPATIELVINGKTSLGAQHSGYVSPTHSGSYIAAVLLDTDDSTEIGDIRTPIIRVVPASNATAADRRVALDLPAGSYSIKLVSVLQSGTYWASSSGSSGGSYVAYSYGLHLNSITAYPRDPLGNRLGEWGAVI